MSRNFSFFVLLSFLSVIALAQDLRMGPAVFLPDAWVTGRERVKTISKGILGAHRIHKEASQRTTLLQRLLGHKKSYSETMLERRPHIKSVRQEILEAARDLQPRSSKSPQELEAELFSLIALGSLPEQKSESNSLVIDVQETDRPVLLQKAAQSQDWQFPGMKDQDLVDSCHICKEIRALFPTAFRVVDRIGPHARAGSGLVDIWQTFPLLTHKIGNFVQKSSQNAKKIEEEAKQQEEKLNKIFDRKKSYTTEMRERREEIKALRYERLDPVNKLQPGGHVVDPEDRLLELLAKGLLPEENEVTFQVLPDFSESPTTLLPPAGHPAQWQVPGMLMAPGGESSGTSAPKQGDEEWYIRTQADAEEHIRLLSDDNRYRYSIEKLDSFPFNDLQNPISVATDLLATINTTGRGLSVLRKSVYAILRKNIFKLRTPELSNLIQLIENSAKLSDNIEFLAELDICGALLTLVTEDPQTLNSIKQNLSPEIIKKKSSHMVILILDTYKNMGFHWKKKWLNPVAKIEELSDRIMSKQQGLNELKRYIHSNCQLDWRVAYMGFREMDRIINKNNSEDIRESAYWTGMSGGESIKISQFANPTPLFSPRGGYSPFLVWQARYLAVKFLLSLKSSENEDIAQDASQKLKTYRKLEKDQRIIDLYAIEDQPLPNKASEEPSPTAQEEDKKSEFIKQIQYLLLKPIPLNLIKQVVALKKIDIAIEDYFQVKNDLCTLKENLSADTFNRRRHLEDVSAKKAILLALGEAFQFQARQIKTWKEARNSVEHIEYLLESFIENTPIELKETICKLIEFYEFTRSNKKKLEVYKKIRNEFAAQLNREKHLSWKTADLDFSLQSSDYGTFFDHWKRDHNLSQIDVTEFKYDKDGSSEFLFSAKTLSGEESLIRSYQENKNIGIEVLRGSSANYENLLKKMVSARNLNAFSRVQDTFDGAAKKGFLDRKDSFLIVEFFENLLTGKEPCTESIILSSVYFVTMFGFVLSENKWGIPTNDELEKIIDMKTCISYLWHVYGDKYAEESYLKYNNLSMKEGGLVLVPYQPTIPTLPESAQAVTEFYNAVLQSSKSSKVGALFEAYESLVLKLPRFDHPRLTLYECSMALQKRLSGFAGQCSSSVYRTAPYLSAIQNHLFTSEIVVLKDLINFILSHTDLKEYDRVGPCFRLLDSSNTLMNDIYASSDIEEQEREKLHRSINTMIAVAEYIAAADVSKTNAAFIKAICNIDIFARSMKKAWPQFERFLSNHLSINELSSPHDAILSIKALMESATKFYVLNGRHSSVILRHSSIFLENIFGEHLDNAEFLSKFTHEILPISSVLWATELDQYFFNIMTVILTICENKYTHESLDEIVRTLNVTSKLRENIKLAKVSQRSLAIQGRLDKLFNTASKDLIDHHIKRLWVVCSEEKSPEKIRDVLDMLDILVKEDETFLEMLEQGYQKFLFSDTKNEFQIESIMVELRERFNHPPRHFRLNPHNVETYKSDGSLFERRKGYDVLGLLLGQKSDLSYLKLEDTKNNFLAALMTPLYLKEARVTAFGAGGKMKMKVSRHGVPENAILPLLKSEEIKNGKIGRLLESITFKEGYYYWQRMFNPYSQGGDVITGTFNIMYADDAQVSFGEITNADGCGFIKASVLGRLTSRISTRDPYSIRKPLQTYQAIHHSKISVDPDLFDEATNECARSVCKEIEQYLSASRSDQASVKELFSTLTTGGIPSGRNFVVIPARGENKIILPLHIKNRDVCLGKTPYEKPINRLLKQEHEIFHLKSDDADKREAATNLAGLTGIQYSLVGTTGESLAFMKGVLVIIPDEQWNYNGIDIVLCTKDQKVDSNWKHRKEAPKNGQISTYGGILTPLQIYGPESFVAISTDIEINRWNSDYDGDVCTIEIKPKDTKMFALMQKTSEHHAQYSTPKIPKTFTKATMEDGQFGVFRFSNIVQSRTANLLTTYTKIHDIFVALKDKHKAKIANSVSHIYLMKNLIGKILVDESLESVRHMLRQDPILTIQKVLSAGIKTGSDSFKSKVNWSAFKEFGRIMKETYHYMGIPDEVVYFKKLCIDMHRTKVNFDDVALEAKCQSRFFDSLPLHVLYKTLSSLPQYQQKRLSQLLVRQMELDENRAILESSRTRFREKPRVQKPRLIYNQEPVNKSIVEPSPNFQSTTAMEIADTTPKLETALMPELGSDKFKSRATLETEEALTDVEMALWSLQQQRRLKFKFFSNREAEKKSIVRSPSKFQNSSALEIDEATTSMEIALRNFQQKPKFEKLRLSSDREADMKSNVQPAYKSQDTSTEETVKLNNIPIPIQKIKNPRIWIQKLLGFIFRM